MRRRSLLLLLLAPAAALPLGGHAAPQGEARSAAYTITDLGTLGEAESYAAALDERGTVVGWTEARGVQPRPFRWRGGKIEPLPLPVGFQGGRAYGMNEGGQVVGTASALKEIRTADTGVRIGEVTAWRAMLWNDGKTVDLGPGEAWDVNNRGRVVGYIPEGRGFTWSEGPGRTELSASQPEHVLHPQALNDEGVVVGAYGEMTTSSRHSVRTFSPFILRGNALTLLTPTFAGPASPAAYAVNAAGHAAGEAPELDGEAFLYRDGRRTDLGWLKPAPVERVLGQHAGFYHSAAYGLNNRGQVVGAVSPRTGARGHENLRAFLWQDGELQDLNGRIDPAAGWVLETARAINDRGQICGWGKHEGRRRAFLLTPVR